MPEQDISSLSPEQLDNFLASLDTGPADDSIVAPVADSPKREIPKKGNEPARNPPKFGNEAFPFLGKSDASIVVEIPKKGNGKTNHHGRDVEKDKSVVRQLVEYRPAFWRRASADPLNRFRSRTTPIGGDDTSLLVPESTETKSTKGSKTKEEHAKVRPSSWNDTTPVLKAIAATMALREAGEDLTAFRLTPHRDIAEKLRSGEIDQSAADYLRRRIVLHVKREVGRVVSGLDPEVIVVTELSPKGTLHVHGVVSRMDSSSLRKALRLAGGEWDDNRQFQLTVTPGPATPGWAPYALKQCGNDASHMSMCRSLNKKANAFYGSFREQRLALRKKQVSQN